MVVAEQPRTWTLAVPGQRRRSTRQQLTLRMEPEPLHPLHQVRHQEVRGRVGGARRVARPPGPAGNDRCRVGRARRAFQQRLRPGRLHVHQSGGGSLLGRVVYDRVAAGVLRRRDGRGRGGVGEGLVAGGVVCCSGGSCTTADVLGTCPAAGRPPRPPDVRRAPRQLSPASVVPDYVGNLRVLVACRVSGCFGGNGHQRPVSINLKYKYALRH